MVTLSSRALGHNQIAEQWIVLTAFFKTGAACDIIAQVMANRLGEESLRFLE